MYLAFIYLYVCMFVCVHSLALYTYVPCFYLRIRMYVRMRSLAGLYIRIRIHFFIACFCISIRMYARMRSLRTVVTCYRAHKPRRVGKRGREGGREREREREKGRDV